MRATEAHVDFDFSGRALLDFLCHPFGCLIHIRGRQEPGRIPVPAALVLGSSRVDSFRPVEARLCGLLCRAVLVTRPYPTIS